MLGVEAEGQALRHADGVGHRAELGEGAADRVAGAGGVLEEDAAVALGGVERLAMLAPMRAIDSASVEPLNEPTCSTTPSSPSAWPVARCCTRLSTDAR